MKIVIVTPDKNKHVIDKIPVYFSYINLLMYQIQKIFNMHSGINTDLIFHFPRYIFEVLGYNNF